MKQKLREEYVGLGGSEGKVNNLSLTLIRNSHLIPPACFSQAMSANYFLYVILFVGTLVIASYLSGAI